MKPARGGTAQRGAASFHDFSDLDVEAHRFFLAPVVVALAIRDGDKRTT